MFSNGIKQRLKILEMLSDKNSNNIPNPIIYFDTEPNQDIYKISDFANNKDYFKNIKDYDKLTFKTEQECQEWIDSNIDAIDLPSYYTNKHKIQAILLKIVDNSHLEKFLYQYNKQDSKGG